MRILLVGEYRYNMGPANVNKKIIEHMTGDFSYIKFQWPKGLDKILNVLELLVKMCFSQVIIVSVTSRIGHIAGRLCHLLHKDLIFIMHGCAEYEYKINGCGSKNGRKRIKNEPETEGGDYHYCGNYVGIDYCELCGDSTWCWQFF